MNNDRIEQYNETEWSMKVVAGCATIRLLGEEMIVKKGFVKNVTSC